MQKIAKLIVGGTALYFGYAAWRMETRALELEHTAEEMNRLIGKFTAIVDEVSGIMWNESEPTEAVVIEANTFCQLPEFVCERVQCDPGICLNAIHAH